METCFVRLFGLHLARVDLVDGADESDDDLTDPLSVTRHFVKE